VPVRAELWTQVHAPRKPCPFCVTPWRHHYFKVKT